MCFLWTRQLHTLSVRQLIFQLHSHTSVTQRNRFRIICVIIWGRIGNLRTICSDSAQSLARHSEADSSPAKSGLSNVLLQQGLGQGLIQCALLLRSEGRNAMGRNPAQGSRGFGAPLGGPWNSTTCFSNSGSDPVSKTPLPGTLLFHVKSSRPPLFPESLV